MRKPILRNGQSAGDIVMLTAAVRDAAMFNAQLQMANVRRLRPALWENSPHLTPLADGAAGAEEIACGYPALRRKGAQQTWASPLARTSAGFDSPRRAP